MKAILKLINLFTRKKKKKGKLMEKRKLWNFPAFRLGMQRLYTQTKLPPLSNP